MLQVSWQAQRRRGMGEGQPAPKKTRQTPTKQRTRSRGVHGLGLNDLSFSLAGSSQADGWKIVSSLPIRILPFCLA